jgi:hypothetical protein
MEISILGYKTNVEILILIGVIYLILVGHTVGSCCNTYGIIESLSNLTNSVPKFCCQQLIDFLLILNRMTII